MQIFIPSLFLLCGLLCMLILIKNYNHKRQERTEERERETESYDNININYFTTHKSILMHVENNKSNNIIITKTKKCN